MIQFYDHLLGCQESEALPYSKRNPEQCWPAGLLLLLGQAHQYWLYVSADAVPCALTASVTWSRIRVSASSNVCWHRVHRTFWWCVLVTQLSVLSGNAWVARKENNPVVLSSSLRNVILQSQHTYIHVSGLLLLLAPRVCLQAFGDVHIP